MKQAIEKMLAIMASQIKRSSVTLAAREKPHKIRDDNQSIHNGVINEEFDANLRSASPTGDWRKRSTESIGNDGSPSNNLGR
jgi:hypothetical protein